MLQYGLGREKPKHSQDIARITFDVYKQSPRDLFGSLNIKATFYGLYSMSCDIQGLGPKRILRSEATRHTCPPLQSQPQQFLLVLSPTVSSPLWETPSLQPVAASQAPPTPDFLLSPPCRELLRWASSLLQGLGHLLLGISSTLRRAVEGSERWQRQGRLKPY